MFLECSDETIAAPILSMLYAGPLHMQTEKDFKIAMVIAQFFGYMVYRIKSLYWRNKRTLVVGHRVCGLLEHLFGTFLIQGFFFRFGTLCLMARKGAQIVIIFSKLCCQLFLISLR